MRRAAMIRTLAAVFGMAALAVCGFATRTRADPIGPGKGRQVVRIGGVDLTLYTYQPDSCRPRLVLIVVHGKNRHADNYRDNAVSLADKTCAVVVAPEFDQARFPRDLFQYGGVATQAPGHRTIDLVRPLATWARDAAGRADLPFVLIGHSAGAQFVDRVAAFAASGAAGIIVANPSTWVLPSTTIAAPYGFGNTERADETAVRTYLAQPVTALLGSADVGSQDLTTTKEAMAQGPNRHVRGLNTFRAVQDVARRRGWKLGWTLADVPGVGHDSTQMFSSPQALDAVQRAVSASPAASAAEKARSFTSEQVGQFLNICSQKADARGLYVSTGAGTARQDFRRTCMQEFGVDPVKTP